MKDLTSGHIRVLGNGCKICYKLTNTLWKELHKTSYNMTSCEVIVAITHIAIVNQSKCKFLIPAKEQIFLTVK